MPELESDSYAMISAIWAVTAQLELKNHHDLWQ